MVEGYSIQSGSLCCASKDDACIWLSVAPDAAEQSELQSRLGISAQAMESSLDPDEVARIEIKPDHLFLIWKRPESFDGRAFNVSSFGVVSSEKRLVVICASNSLLSSLEHDLQMTGPVDVLMALLAESVHHYLGHLRVVKQIAREIQHQFTRAMDNQQLAQMYNLSESLVYYVNAIQGNGAVLTLLRNHGQRQGFSDRQLDSLNDLIIENEQSYQQAKIHAKVFANLIESHGNLANNSMNRALRKLTLINVVFLPLNLIAGIGGMSEFSMMTSGVPWWMSFPVLIMCMGFVGAGMVYALRRMA
ncbi:magnesium transporter CorA family protein [Pseudomonas viridiflava]|uniref:Magnesium transporter CorA family protein n=3 Tax=Pseudomonas TaxID=286 RepID=A0A8I0CUU2_9PSED|nr:MULTISPECIES: magnesium transporter CorA family protein [Pseudomonas]MEE3937718.1 magnesium transporter CorA family protein [Pseudomonas viridiflava]MBP2873736.1 magnesium transporter CorA family protein [Pseudomonas sp. SWRI144]MEE4042518.1 magnesium transporter CorA family protein [Pseudomonas viridiflava]MEE4062488.1 magnesium transporter CorA family protein [Pseudomonas viridiflava]MEE4171868.1 magnesium transporter CorA family protein [Pseudomonas viridiflava]